MRFSLQDVRKSVQRRGGTLGVSLHFLRAGELQDEIARLIAYYERLLGEPQRLFSAEEARTCIGEYRMANCLIATLSHWYSWQSRSWEEVVHERGGNAPLLALATPAQLRLALYTFVNTHYAGFLPAPQRQAALRVFAEPYGLNVADLEYLLVLDSDDEALLVRPLERAPEVQEVAALYNQWTFEAALFNASYVHFVIDCDAFRGATEGPDQWLPEAGVGAVIKRLCYLARRLGVYYDLEYEEQTGPAKAGTPAPIMLHMTLYGPQEVTGTPHQYGLRLARLCRLLLGYGASTTGSRQGVRGAKKLSLANGIVEAEARVHFLQRAYLFAMDAHLLQLLPGTGQDVDSTVHEASSEYSSALFDSSIEQTFAEGFNALARNQGVDGWLLEREPEPLLLTRGIFIPDFALTRRDRRIYVEILGFWTPAYRERKLQKLLQLRDRDDLLLLIPWDAREAFSSIEQDFPVVFYKDQISIADVLHVLRQRYDDFASRLAQIDIAGVQRIIQRRGFVAERECGELLHCDRRSELQLAAERVCANPQVTGNRCIYVPGFGLYTQSWLAQLKHTVLLHLSQQQQKQSSITLSTALALLQTSDPALQACEESVLETILSLWPELVIQHNSIFDATVTLAEDWTGTASAQLEEAQAVFPGEHTDMLETAPVPPAKKAPRERRTSASKKRSTTTSDTSAPVVQGDLWS